MVTISQGERAVIEFSYKYPGDYMFHAHQNEFADKGWMGVFRVVDDFEVGGGAERRAAESGGH
jgi:FtsP/CotA-like multicopper oxidase with cupredoxin domain